MLHFSLSTIEGAFTNAIRVLEPNSTSEVLSSTLAPNGDFLVFQNPSADIIQVELTILDN